MISENSNWTFKMAEFLPSALSVT